MAKQFHNQTVPGQQEHDDKLLMIQLSLALSLAAIWVVGMTYQLLVCQLAVVFVLALIAGTCLIGTGREMAARRKEANRPGPKPRLMVSDAEERRCVARAIADGTTQQRSMQTALPRNSGAGKAALIYSIVEQDIKRVP